MRTEMKAREFSLRPESDLHVDFAHLEFTFEDHDVQSSRFADSRRHHGLERAYRSKHASPGHGELSRSESAREARVVAALDNVKLAGRDFTEDLLRGGNNGRRLRFSLLPSGDRQRRSYKRKQQQR